MHSSERSFSIETDLTLEQSRDPQDRADLDDLRKIFRSMAGPQTFVESSGPMDRVGQSIQRLDVFAGAQEEVRIEPWHSRTYGTGPLSEMNLQEDRIVDASGKPGAGVVLKRVDGVTYARPVRGEPIIVRAANGRLVPPDDYDENRDPNLAKILDIINGDPRLARILAELPE